MVKPTKAVKLLWERRVKELTTKSIIDKDQEDSLLEMIRSPDIENFTIVEQVIKVMIRSKLAEGLNVGQADALNKIIDFIENPQHDALVLKGYAGTGKTFLIKRIIEYIAQTETTKKIAITAPTNKAVQVLYKSSASAGKDLNTNVFEDIFDAKSRLSYSTIHKLLGLKQKISSSGEQIFEAEKKDSNINSYHFLIVDEVSMLDDFLCNEIMEHSNRMRIIFTGDPCQIPPVGKMDCIPFSKNSKYNFERVELTEIMRQKGEHPIVDSSFIIRNNLSKSQPISLLSSKVNENGHGIFHIDSKPENKDVNRVRILSILEQYFKTDAFKEDTDYMKVIAWRNKTVEYVNTMVREILYGINPDTYIIGEKIVVRTPIFHKVKHPSNKYKEYYKILFNNSDELEITSVNIQNRRFDEGHFYGLNLKTYVIGVLYEDPITGDHEHETITIIHEDSINDYNQLLNKTKQKAIISRQAVNWIMYYNILKWSADISYNYAISAHRSQGSSYKNVLLLEDDLDMNKNIVERNRIKYTSYTRASELLYILRKN